MLVLTGANVIDGVPARPLANATVVVRGGRLERVSTTRGPAPPGARVVDLGGRWVLPGLVDAHAHTDDAVRAALLAGARTIEHGTLVSDTTLHLMKERGTCLVPTLPSSLDMLDAGGEYDDSALVSRAHRVGVAVAVGSDMNDGRIAVEHLSGSHRGGR